MTQFLENLSSREYPGRIIIIGQDKSKRNMVVIYAITGRSPSSQARKLEMEEDAIWTSPADEEVLKKGNRDLLVYPAILFVPARGIAVSNGRQTSDIGSNLLKGKNPLEILESALSPWDFEPDKPIFTPRISGCVLSGKGAALSIIRRNSDGSSSRDFYEVPLVPGRGMMIATYSGENRDPVPSFIGEPVEVEIHKRRADDMAEAVYDALEPEPGKKDLRVSVACVYSNKVSAGQNEIYIINRKSGMEE